jgi:hypothetical protein
LAAPSTEVASMPFLTLTAANGVPGHDRLADNAMPPAD